MGPPTNPVRFRGRLAVIELEKGVHGAVNGRAIREATRPECVDPPRRGNEKRQPDAEGIALHGLSLSDFRSGPLNGFRRENRTKVWSKMCAAIRGVCLMAEGTPPAAPARPPPTLGLPAPPRVSRLIARPQLVEGLRGRRAPRRAPIPARIGVWRRTPRRSLAERWDSNPQQLDARRRDDRRNVCAR